jgi:hypothetical protein
MLANISTDRVSVRRRSWTKRFAPTAGAMALMALSGGTPALATSGTWSVVASPNPSPTNSSLSAVSCASASSCFAVGGQFGSPYMRAVTERWNGLKWSVVPSPSPGVSSSFAGVSCVDASFCMAVGSSWPTNSAFNALIEAWNGVTWSVLPIPVVTATFSELIHVSCTSASACVAVGWSATGNTTTSLAEQWNGTAWSLMAGPNPAPPGVLTVLSGVSCVSATSCVAVGYHGAGPNHRTMTLIERWDGATWSIVPSPNRYVGPSAGNGFRGVSCASGNECFAVGSTGNGGPGVTLVEQWNGAAWVIVPSPNHNDNSNWLLGVSCPTTTACYAVGDAYDNAGISHTLMESWNGAAWVRVPSPRLSEREGFVIDVSCATSITCEAVGYAEAGGSTLRQITLVEQHS